MFGVHVLILTFITNPLIHIHEKKEIALKIAAKSPSVNEPLNQNNFINTIDSSISPKLFSPEVQ